MWSQKKIIGRRLEQLPFSQRKALWESMAKQDEEASAVKKPSTRLFGVNYRKGIERQPRPTSDILDLTLGVSNPRYKSIKRKSLLECSDQSRPVEGSLHEATGSCEKVSDSKSKYGSKTVDEAFKWGNKQSEKHVRDNTSELSTKKRAVECKMSDNVTRKLRDERKGEEVITKVTKVSTDARITKFRPSDILPKRDMEGRQNSNSYSEKRHRQQDKSPKSQHKPYVDTGLPTDKTSGVKEESSDFNAISSKRETRTRVNLLDSRNFNAFKNYVHKNPHVLEERTKLETFDDHSTKGNSKTKSITPKKDVLKSRNYPQTDRIDGKYLEGYTRWSRCRRDSGSSTSSQRSTERLDVNETCNQSILENDTVTVSHPGSISPKGYESIFLGKRDHFGKPKDISVTLDKESKLPNISPPLNTNMGDSTITSKSTSPQTSPQNMSTTVHSMSSTQSPDLMFPSKLSKSKAASSLSSAISNRQLDGSSLRNAKTFSSDTSRDISKRFSESSVDSPLISRSINRQSSLENEDDLSQHSSSHERLPPIKISISSSQTKKKANDDYSQESMKTVDRQSPEKSTVIPITKVNRIHVETGTFSNYMEPKSNILQPHRVPPLQASNEMSVISGNGVKPHYENNSLSKDIYVQSLYIPNITSPDSKQPNYQNESESLNGSNTKGKTNSKDVGSIDTKSKKRSHKDTANSSTQSKTELKSKKMHNATVSNQHDKVAWTGNIANVGMLMQTDKNNNSGLSKDLSVNVSHKGDGTNSGAEKQWADGQATNLCYHSPKQIDEGGGYSPCETITHASGGKVNLNSTPHASHSAEVTKVDTLPPTVERGVTVNTMAVNKGYTAKTNERDIPIIDKNIPLDKDKPSFKKRNKRPSHSPPTLKNIDSLRSYSPMSSGSESISSSRLSRASFHSSPPQHEVREEIHQDSVIPRGTPLVSETTSTHNHPPSDGSVPKTSPPSYSSVANVNVKDSSHVSDKTYPKARLRAHGASSKSRPKSYPGIPAPKLDPNTCAESHFHSFTTCSYKPAVQRTAIDQNNKLDSKAYTNSVRSVSSNSTIPGVLRKPLPSFLPPPLPQSIGDGVIFRPMTPERKRQRKRVGKSLESSILSGNESSTFSTPVSSRSVTPTRFGGFMDYDDSEFSDTQSERSSIIEGYNGSITSDSARNGTNTPLSDSSRKSQHWRRRRSRTNSENEGYDSEFSQDERNSDTEVPYAKGSYIHDEQEQRRSLAPSQKLKKRMRGRASSEARDLPPIPTIKPRNTDQNVALMKTSHGLVGKAIAVPPDKVMQNASKMQLDLIKNKQVVEKELSQKLENNMEKRDSLAGVIKRSMNNERCKDQVKGANAELSNIVSDDVEEDYDNKTRTYKVKIQLGDYTHNITAKKISDFKVIISGSTKDGPRLTKEIDIEFPRAVDMQHLDIVQIGSKMEIRVPYKYWKPKPTLDEAMVALECDPTNIFSRLSGLEFMFRRAGLPWPPEGGDAHYEYLTGRYMDEEDISQLYRKSHVGQSNTT